MRILLLLLLASGPVLSQIPYSANKPPLTTIKPSHDPSKLLSGSLRRVLRKPTPNLVVKDREYVNYQMPIKKGVSFDEMNTDFYFDQKRTTISDPEK